MLPQDLKLLAVGELCFFSDLLKLAGFIRSVYADAPTPKSLSVWLAPEHQLWVAVLRINIPQLWNTLVILLDEFPCNPS